MSCSEGDSFYLNVIGYSWDGLDTFDGCYVDSGFTENFLPEYFPGGEKVEGPVVYASDEYFTPEVWVLAYYDGTFSHRCKDDSESDASLIHPTEVTEWICADDDGEVYTREDAIVTTCGCPDTPAPTTALEPTPELTPTTCSDGDSFYLNVLGYSWDGLSTFDGCYVDSGFTANFLPLYYQDGEEVAVVYASDEYFTPEVWVLAYYDESEGYYYHRCKDYSESDASLIHPTEVTEWICADDDGEFYTREDAIDTTCGCPDTPAPTTVLEPTPRPVTPTPDPTPDPTPEPTPGPTVQPTLRPTGSPTMAAVAPTAGPVTPTPAPLTPTRAPLESSSSAPLGAVIGGVVGGATLLAIGGLFVAKRRRDKEKTGTTVGPPPPGAENLPVVSGGGATNYPVISGDGGKNYPVIEGDGATNYPVVSGDGGKSYPVVEGGEGKHDPVTPLGPVAPDAAHAASGEGGSAPPPYSSPPPYGQ